MVSSQDVSVDIHGKRSVHGCGLGAHDQSAHGIAPFRDVCGSAVSFS